MSGVKIAALYGIYPFQLGLCGPQEESKKKILFNYLSGKKIPEKMVREILEQFKGAFTYYKLIADSNRIKDPFDERVVRAYWIGNEFLDTVPVDSLKKMIIKEFSGPGLISKKIAVKKTKEIPPSSKPHHSFHVFVIGSVTGTVKLKGKLLDICRVGWGKVIKKAKNKVIIKYQPIKKSKGKYYLGNFVEKIIFWDRNIVSKVKTGNWVSCHWNHLIQVLHKECLANLKKYTKITLNSLNG